MRYPLNTVPINGNQTLYGSGAADMVMGMSGDAIVQRMGSGAADMQLLSTGNGFGRLYTGSGAADMAMGTSGSGYAQLHCSGDASMLLAASGSAPVTTVGSGIAALALNASGISRGAITGAGQASMALDTLYIPIALPWPIPAGPSEEHRSRIISVARVDRSITVPRDERIIDGN